MEELKKHALRQLEESVSAFDAIDMVDDHDLSLFTQLCGGGAAPLTVEDALDHTRALGQRLGRLFSAEDVRDAVATLLKIQQHELHRAPADPSNPTVSAAELAEHLKERRHAKQQRANKIRQVSPNPIPNPNPNPDPNPNPNPIQLSLPADSPERLALEASARASTSSAEASAEATSSAPASAPASAQASTPVGASREVNGEATSGGGASSAVAGSKGNRLRWSVLRWPATSHAELSGAPHP